MMMRLAVVAFAAFAEGRFLTTPSHAADHIAPEKSQTPQNATHKNVSVVPLTDEQKLANLQHGLMAIKGLKAMFQSDSELSGGNQFAQGALSSELSKDKSGIWDTINTMMAAADEASKKMKSNDMTAAEKTKVMDSLETTLDGKATDLNKGLGQVNEHQQDLDEEYVLGLLIMHQKDWTLDQQLNATFTLKKNSPLLEDLYEHHDSGKPLAAQLAALMDKKKAAKASAMPAKTESAHPADTKSAPKAVQTTSKSKSAKVAAKLFLQLATSFREI